MRGLTREKARRMARASWTVEARARRKNNRHPDVVAEEKLEQQSIDLRGEPLRGVQWVNPWTGETGEVLLSFGEARRNQYGCDGVDGLDRRRLGDALLRAMGI